MDNGQFIGSLFFASSQANSAILSDPFRVTTLFVQEKNQGLFPQSLSTALRYFP